MGSALITPKKVAGTVKIPPSKSHSIRAVYFAALAEGRSTIKNLLPSPDVEAMMAALESFGAIFTWKENTLEVNGFGGTPKPSKNCLNVGNSGLAYRMLAATIPLSHAPVTLTGDHSIQTSRPIIPLLNALKELGVQCEGTKAPITIRGPYQGGNAEIYAKDSQILSSLLMAASFAPVSTHLDVKELGEKPWVELTLSWLKRLNIPYENRDFKAFLIPGSARIKGFNYTVPSDFSSAAFPAAAALVTGSTLTLEGLDFSDAQGDKIVFHYLEKMGARLVREGTCLTIHPSTLQGMTIDMDTCIDAVPILAVLGCYAKGTTHLVNASGARVKECDRLACITSELQKMGARIEELPDALIIHSSSLSGANVQSHDDHRVAMSLAVAALGAGGTTHLQGTACINKTYPAFIDWINFL